MSKAAHHAFSRPVHALRVPVTPGVVPRLLTPLKTALEGGPAVMPLPEGPAAVRADLQQVLRPDEPVDVDDSADPVALIVPTSGSTGEPKGVLLTASALRASATATHDRLGGPGRWLLATPATHIAGLMVLVRSIIAGTHPVPVDLSHGFDPEVFAAASMRVLGTGGPYYTAVVPTQLHRILEAGGAALDALAAFDAVLVGGAAASQELLARARSARVAVVTTYGMTETCGGCLYDGVPLDGARVHVDSDGRVRLTGPMLARGYRFRPDLTAEAFTDGWFRTSDLGRLSADGSLSVLGRVDDVVVSGGVNIPLAAVEAQLSAHPSVGEVAALGVPDEEWGQRLIVAVVPRNPELPPTLDSLRVFVSRRAPAAFAPHEVHLLERLPLLGPGKIDRPRLAEIIDSRRLASTRDSAADGPGSGQRRPHSWD